MLLPSYAVLLVIGVILNFKDWRMLGITLLIGANVFAPIPSNSALSFYFCCSLAEMAVIAGALYLKTPGSLLVVEVSIVLIIAHLMGYALDGYQAMSPYRLIVKVCEYGELFACIFFSPVVCPHFRTKRA